MKATKLFILLLLVSICQLGFSQTKLYLGFDANCMDRYEYHYNNNPTGNAHIAYHIILNDREKVVLEVGIESRINQARPKNVKTCGKFSINERMVRKINNGEAQLFIVKKNGNGYNVSEVGKAAYSQISPASISVSSMDSRFAHKYSQPANGKNLATKGSPASVYFDGVVSHDCPKQFQFNEKRSTGGRNYTEWVMIPEVGIIQQKKGFNQTDAENNVLNLTHVNGVPVDRYLSDFCRSVDLDFYSGKFYNGEQSKDYVIGGEVADDNNWEANDRNNSNSGIGTKIINTVTSTVNTRPNRSTSTCNIYKDLDRGLYIDWSTGQPANKECGGATYRNGMMLGSGVQIVDTRPTTQPTNTTIVVTEPTPTRSVNTNFCNEESRYGYHVVQRNETLFGIARLYGLNVSQIRLWNGLTNDRIYPCAKLKTIAPNTATNTTSIVVSEKGGGGNYHIVRKNETLFQLAKTYGYTVDRFRAINGLNKSDMIYVGQRLRTGECNCPNPNSNTDAIAYAPAASSPQVVAYNSNGGPQEYSYVGTERLVAKGNEARVEYTNGKKRRVHIVKDNDNIFQIAKKYGLSVAQLRSINDLEENEVIIPYQRIYLDY